MTLLLLLACLAPRDEIFGDGALELSAVAVDPTQLDWSASVTGGRDSLSARADEWWETDWPGCASGEQGVWMMHSEGRLRGVRACSGDLQLALSTWRPPEPGESRAGPEASLELWIQEQSGADWTWRMVPGASGTLGTLSAGEAFLSGAFHWDEAPVVLSDGQTLTAALDLSWSFDGETWVVRDP
ncbi:MAG: hypothetical protein H6740_19650 [Alphaproteobacteria bacterium]|nr:hypothetical protein [Alphaproteobacteria bacterium]